MIYLWIIPWLSTLIDSMIFLFVYVRRRFKSKYYESDFHSVDQDDLFSFNVGILFIVASLNALISAVGEEIQYPGILMHGATIFFDLILIIIGIILMIPYFTPLTRIRALYIPIALAFIIAQPFINWPGIKNYPPEFTPVIFALVLIIIGNPINTLLFFIAPEGKFLFKIVKNSGMKLKEKLIAKKTMNYLLLGLTILTFVAIELY